MQAALTEQQHPVGKRRCSGRVSDEHARGTALTDLCGQQPHQHRCRFGIEVTGGLVGQYQQRPVHERPGHGHPLQLAAGEFARQAAGAIGQADCAEQFSNALLALAGSDTEQHQRQLDVLADTQMRQDMEGLEHETEPRATQARARIVVQRGEVLAADQDFSGIGLVEPGDQVEQRGLAGTGLTDDGDEFARRDRQIETVENLPADRSAGKAG